LRPGRGAVDGAPAAVALKPLPHTFVATRRALHRVAAELVAPARKPQNEIALCQTPGGFGTPEFEFAGRRTQVRVDGIELVLTRDGRDDRAELRSLAAAGALLGPDLLPDGVPGDDTPLDIDAEAAAVLADFYAFAADLLERLKSALTPQAEASETNLWPEHFDIAFEAGPDAAGERATYGASPGDDEHSEPYLYVGPWSATLGGELWNATAFKGAELGYAELRGAEDPAATAAGFMRSRYEALTATG
jgi:hypothetical protein